MKYLTAILAGIFVVSACGKAPVKPTDNPVIASGLDPRSDQAANIENHDHVSMIRFKNIRFNC